MFRQELPRGTYNWLTWSPRLEALRHIPRYEEGLWKWSDIEMPDDLHDKVSKRGVIMRLKRDGLVEKVEYDGDYWHWRTAPLLWEELEDAGVSRPSGERLAPQT